MKKTLSILGSTGSIGLSVLTIIEKKKIFLKLTSFQQIKITILFANK